MYSTKVLILLREITVRRHMRSQYFSTPTLQMYGKLQLSTFQAPTGQNKVLCATPDKHHVTQVEVEMAIVIGTETQSGLSNDP